VSETDFKTLIDGVTEARSKQFESNEYTSIAFAYKSGAWLPNNLLLIALEALDKITNHDGHRHSMGTDEIAEDATDMIRRALEAK